jgi:hypothetical protein
MSDRTELIADLLMGAALADSELDGRELDIASTVAALELETDEDKRYLLELIAAVHNADDVWDLDEDKYLREVAAALGMPERAYADLTIEVIDLQEAGRSLMPPPLPGSGPKPPPLPK